MSAYPPPVTSPGWSSRTKRTVVLIALLVLAVLAWRLTEILPIIVIALDLSYILFPIARFIDNRLLTARRVPARTQSVLAILLTFLLVVAALVIVVLVGDTIVMTASTQITFSDYGVEVPSSPIVLSVDDVGTLELQLLLVRS